MYLAAVNPRPHGIFGESNDDDKPKKGGLFSRRNVARVKAQKASKKPRRPKGDGWGKG